jgi:glyoxylase-like metal-dependent hydrolase (beta-lactamase superfamily II)
MELPRDHVNAFVVELERSVVIVDTTLALSPDHYTGLIVFEDLPRFGSQGCLDFALSEDAVKSSTATGYLGDDYPKTRAFPNKIVKDKDSLTFGGVEFTFRDLGPGESDNDGIWVFEHDGVKSVFAGDLIANQCHCFFRDGHIKEWNQSLDWLEKEFDESTQFYYGHGETPGGMEIVRWQRGYNNAFLDAVASLEDKSVPVSRESQEKVIAAMQEYLPGEATLFLLDYELDVTIEELWKKLGLK